MGVFFFTGKSLRVAAILTFLAIVSINRQSEAAEALNVRLVGQSDLQGRDALQVVLKGNFAYVGHHRGEALNPLAGRVEPNGTTILDVSNPGMPRIVKHIPGRKGAESRAV